MSVTWKPLVISPDPDLARRLAAVLDELTAGIAVVRTEYPPTGAMAALVRESGSNICFLDAATNAEHAQLLIAEAAPLVPVAALHHRNDADLILRCLRRGACEYLADPGLEAVRSVFERLARAHGSAGRPTGAVYCVVPGKPGSGASSLAVQLAAELRAGGKARVLLVDGDPMNGSVAFQLKLKSEFHLGDALRDWHRMDDDLWARLMIPAGGVDVLPAPESAATRIEVSPATAASLCGFWRERYAFTVLDLPDVRAAVDCGFAAVADSLLLVTTNELAALQSTRRAVGYFDSGAADRTRLRLILNRYMPATGLKREDIKTALGLEPFEILANDYDVMQTALLDGRPAPPNSRFAQSVHALAARLERKPAAAKSNGSWISALLHR